MQHHAALTEEVRAISKAFGNFKPSSTDAIELLVSIIKEELVSLILKSFLVPADHDATLALERVTSQTPGQLSLAQIFPNINKEVCRFQRLKELLRRDSPQIVGRKRNRAEDIEKAEDGDRGSHTEAPEQQKQQQQQRSHTQHQLMSFAEFQYRIRSIKKAKEQSKKRAELISAIRELEKNVSLPLPSQSPLYSSSLAMDQRRMVAGENSNQQEEDLLPSAANVARFIDLMHLEVELNMEECGVTLAFLIKEIAAEFSILSFIIKTSLQAQSFCREEKEPERLSILRSLALGSLELNRLVDPHPRPSFVLLAESKLNYEKTLLYIQSLQKVWDSKRFLSPILSEHVEEAFRLLTLQT